MATLPQAQLAYLALGDSYSIGEGVAEQGRWPMQLALGLREAGIAIADPRIIATTGWTTDELSAAMDAAEPLGEWDFVSLLIGVNNQYRGRDVDDYLGEFVRLLQRAIALANAHAGRVLVPATRSAGSSAVSLVHAEIPPSPSSSPFATGNASRVHSAYINADGCSPSSASIAGSAPRVRDTSAMSTKATPCAAQASRAAPL